MLNRAGAAAPMLNRAGAAAPMLNRAGAAAPMQNRAAVAAPIQNRFGAAGLAQNKGGAPSVTKILPQTTNASSSGDEVKTGYVFVCNTDTYKKCQTMNIFGNQSWELGKMKSHITDKTLLFLLHMDSRRLLGTFVAVGTPEKNIVPNAFDGKFEAQVRVKPASDGGLVAAQLDCRITGGPKRGTDLQFLTDALLGGTLADAAQQAAWSAPAPEESEQAPAKGKGKLADVGTKRPWSDASEEQGKGERNTWQKTGGKGEGKSKCGKGEWQGNYNKGAKGEWGAGFGKGKGKWQQPGWKGKFQQDEPIAPEDVPAALRKQIEYYFSDKNLVQDDFFHKKISEDPEGWLDASMILGCRKVKALGEIATVDDAEIEACLLESHLETRSSPTGEIQVRRPDPLPELNTEMASKFMPSKPAKPPPWRQTPAGAEDTNVPVNGDGGGAPPKAPIAKVPIVRTEFAPKAPVGKVPGSGGIAKAPLTKTGPAIAAGSISNASAPPTNGSKPVIAKVATNGGVAAKPLAAKQMPAGGVAPKAMVTKSPPASGAPGPRPVIAKGPAASGGIPPKAAATGAGATPAVAKTPLASSGGVAPKAPIAKRPPVSSGNQTAIAKTPVAKMPIAKKPAAVQVAIPKAATAPVTFSPGDQVQVLSGEFEGQVAEVCNVEDGDVTIIVCGDVVVVTAAELAPSNLTASHCSPVQEEVPAAEPVSELEERRAELRALMSEPANVARFLNQGRLVHVQDGATDIGWGILLAAAKRAPTPGPDGRPVLGADPGAPPCVIADVFIRGASGEPEGGVLPVTLGCISRLSKMRTKLPAGDVKTAPVRAALSKSLARLPAEIPELHPVNDMNIQSAAGLLERIAELECSA
jgi:hypothetical protein